MTVKKKRERKKETFDLNGFKSHFMLKTLEYSLSQDFFFFFSKFSVQENLASLSNFLESLYF